MMNSVNRATRDTTRGQEGTHKKRKEGNTGRSDVVAMVDVPVCLMFDHGCVLLTTTSSTGVVGRDHDRGGRGAAEWRRLDERRRDGGGVDRGSHGTPWSHLGPAILDLVISVSGYQGLWQEN